MASYINVITSAGGGIALTGDSSGVLSFQSAGTTYMTMDASGNLGVGTSSPTGVLNVYRSSGIPWIDVTGGSYNTRLFTNSGGSGLSGVFATTANPLVFGTNNTEYMRIDSSGNVGIGTSSPTAKLNVVGSSSNIVATFDKGATLQAATQLKNSAQTYSNYVDINNNGTNWWALYDTTNAVLMDVYVPGASAYRAFYTVGTERMRIDSSGKVLVNTTTNVGAEKLGIVFDGSAGQGMNIKTTYSGNGSGYIGFYNSAGTPIGNINQATGSTVQYATSSDYRLKENVAPMTGALEVVAQLKPVTYDWISDGSKGQGFIAHELGEIFPDCVAGEKDAVDEEGNPVYQGIDTSFLVATLTAAIQEQQAIITQLQADVAALKGAK